MSLSESVLKKLSKEEVIDLALQYQNKFDSTLANVNKEISDLEKLRKNAVRTLRLQKSQLKIEGANSFVRATVLGYLLEL